jgi:glycosyltransferase involved in cell wall biosynthesis
MQNTNFNFEVLIGEDCSTDSTREIVKEFEEKYPNIIKPIYRNKNIGATLNFRDVLLKAQSKHIAICEGDDFFTDEHKLQLQADFLDKNPDYSMCFHPGKVIYENNEKEESIFPEHKDREKFTVEELLRGNFMLTNTVMYRRLEYKNLPTNIIPGDWYLHLYHAKFGEIGFIDKVMSVYRRHAGGIWWDSHKNPDNILEKHGAAILAMYFELLKLYEDKKEYKDIIMGNINDLLNRFTDIDKRDNCEGPID